ncbi:MAG: right-handed parallel beta-helix repeat-containing protein, partial [Kiritimatiellae bacterium]|nr:right-handed parallel beta-helix repeat-containing protein [Kiritimatiellia bacterium]
PFELTDRDGGTATAPVVYRARKPGKTRIRGGLTLKAIDFKTVDDPAVLARLYPAAHGKIMVCDLGNLPQETFPSFPKSYRGTPPAPWLYVDGHPMTLARWPNDDAPEAGWAGFDKSVDTGLAKPDAPDPALRKPRPGAFVFDDPRPARWNLNHGVWLLGYWTHDWYDEVIRVAAYDPDHKTVKLAAPHIYGIKGGTWGSAKRRFFALNLLEELDVPGEWYLDRDAKLLFLYPPTDLANSEIVLATLRRNMLQVKSAKHIKLLGLAFEYAHDSGISLNDTEHIDIAGCELSNLAGTGISVNGRENLIRSCDLFHLGRNGISLTGGDRKSLAPANNIAQNNHVHHYALFQRTYAPAISAQGCGQIVRHNLIHDAPHNAITYGGNEHVIELNNIFRVVMETGDAGALYTGRDWTSQGNMIRHNFIHHLGGGDDKHVNTMGVYLDDCDCGDTIEGNVFFRAGRAIMLGGGRDNPVLNNLIVDCPIGLHIDSRGMTWNHWNNPEHAGWNLEEKANAMNYTNPPWSVLYPRLANIMNDSPREPLYNPVLRNVFVDCTKKVYAFSKEVKSLLDKFEISGNLAVNTVGTTNNIAMADDLKGFKNLYGSPQAPVDLGFADAAAGDFSLRRQARLLQELPDFQPIPFERIGLYKDDFRRKLPPREL